MKKFIAMFLVGCLWASPVPADVSDEEDAVARVEVIEALKDWVSEMEAMEERLNVGEYSRAEEVVAKVREERNRAVELLRSVRDDRDTAIAAGQYNVDILGDWANGCLLFEATEGGYMTEFDTDTSVYYPGNTAGNLYAAASTQCLSGHLLRENYACKSEHTRHEFITLTYRVTSSGLSVYDVRSRYAVTRLRDGYAGTDALQMAYGLHGQGLDSRTYPYVSMRIASDGASGSFVLYSLEFAAAGSNVREVPHGSTVDFTVGTDGALIFADDFYAVTDGETALGLTANQGAQLGLHLQSLYERLPDLEDGTLASDAVCGT